MYIPHRQIDSEKVYKFQDRSPNKRKKLVIKALTSRKVLKRVPLYVLVRREVIFW